MLDFLSYTSQSNRHCYFLCTYLLSLAFMQQNLILIEYTQRSFNSHEVWRMSVQIFAGASMICISKIFLSLVNHSRLRRKPLCHFYHFSPTNVDQKMCNRSQNQVHQNFDPIFDSWSLCQVPSFQSQTPCFLHMIHRTFDHEAGCYIKQMKSVKSGILKCRWQDLW